MPAKDDPPRARASPAASGKRFYGLRRLTRVSSTRRRWKRKMKAGDADAGEKPSCVIICQFLRRDIPPPPASFQRHPPRDVSVLDYARIRGTPTDWPGTTPFTRLHSWLFLLPPGCRACC